jgi:long-chain acyl-CoA synthetase
MSALQSISSPVPGMAAGPRGPRLRPRRLRDIGASGECPGQSVLALLEEHAQQHPLNRALVMLDGEHARAVTYVELAQRVKSLTAALSARFPDGGEPIAILAESSPAWGIVALATIASRNVLVPLDTSMEAEALAAVLRRVRPVILFSSATRFDDACTLAAGNAELTDVRPLDPSQMEVALAEAAAAPVRCSDFKPTPGTAVMAFTSGTTGSPKAVEISFDNLLFQIRALTARFSLRPSDRLLSLLPMHHMLEFTVGFLCPLWRGAQVNYLHSLLPDEVLERMRTLGITRVITVPAWLALLKRALARDAQSSSTLRSHTRQAFGADFEHFVCGGAPLADEIADFFETAAVPVVQGYGLTETSPVVATNVRSDLRRGSVGRPLSGTEAHISEAGEILVRGPQVAARYRLDSGSAQPVTDDAGWFHTGDLGHLDSDGFLYVTGRIKTTIVLPSGKNVQPEEIEARLQTGEDFAEVCVVATGDGNSGGGEEICLVAVPSSRFVADCEAALEDVEQALQRRIRECLACLAPYKRPRRVILRGEPLPRTVTGKLRRADVTKWARMHVERQS